MKQPINKKSVKFNVLVRVVGTIVALSFYILSSGIFHLQMSSDISEIESTTKLTELAHNSETAHLTWLNNLGITLFTSQSHEINTNHETCTLGKWIHGTDLGTDDEEILRLIDEIKPLHQQVHADAKIALELHGTNTAAAQGHFDTVITPNINVIFEKLNSINARANEINNSNISAYHLKMYIMWAVSGICGLFSFVSLITLISYIVKQVLTPVLDITRESKNLSKGQLSFDYEYNNDNEIGELAHVFRDSVNSISSYVHDIDMMMDAFAKGDFTKEPSMNYIGDFKNIETAIRRFSQSIKGILAEIDDVANQVSSSSNEVSMGTQALAQGATEQAGSVETLSETLNKLSASATENAGAAEKAMERLHQANNEVNSCNDKMQDLISAMELINQSSEEISKIIKTIEDIAFQTNILALNAAVEASRAGVSGKGFAVVATEVRNLAGKSDEAAKATNDLIVKSMQAVQNGNNIVNDVSDALQKTAGLSSEAVSDMNEIAKAVTVESKAIEEVDDGIEQISIVVQSNTATSEEQAAASEELSSQAALLKEKLGMFRL